MYVRLRLNASPLRALQSALVLLGVSATALFAWLQFERYYFGSLYLQEIERSAPHPRIRAPIGVRDTAAARPAEPGQPPAPSPPASSPLATSPQAPGPVALARVRVPRLELEAPVLNGVDARSLRRGAGWIPGTALPWEPGNVGIAAHRDTFFRPLRRIRTGDRVDLDTQRGVRTYRVRAVYVVEPDYQGALRPTVEPTLTMVTCFPFDFVGPAPRRYVVQAVEIPAPSPMKPLRTGPTPGASSPKTPRAGPARKGG